MKANATRDQETMGDLMAPMAGKVSESMLLIMQMFGIQKSECKKLKSADYERVIADVTFFDGVPDDIKRCGMLIKDAIASILAASGVISLEVTPEGDELAKLQEGYEKLLKSHLTGGSGTDGVTLDDKALDVAPKGEDKPKRKARKRSGKKCECRKS